MKKNLVSIIIPLYNNEKYIEKCISSVLKQNYDDIEIIVIDDGSTDNSKKIVENMNCQKVILISQENSGPSKARNKGIEKSSGEWIVFLDSDDTLKENAIIDFMNEIQKEKNLDMIIGGWEGQYSTKSVYYGPKEETILIKDEIELLGNYLLSSCTKKVNSKIEINSIEGPVGKMYSNKIIKKEKIYFPTDLRYAEDVCFNYKYLQYCNRIKTINNTIYLASRHDDSLSNSYKKFMQFAPILEKYIISANINQWNIKDNLIYRYLYWTLNDLEKTASKSYKEFCKELEKAQKIDFSFINNNYLTYFKTLELSALKLNKLLAYILFKIFNKIRLMKRVKNNEK